MDAAGGAGCSGSTRPARQLESRGGLPVRDPVGGERHPDQRGDPHAGDRRDASPASGELARAIYGDAHRREVSAKKTAVFCGRCHCRGFPRAHGMNPSSVVVCSSPLLSFISCLFLGDGHDSVLPPPLPLPRPSIHCSFSIPMPLHLQRYPAIPHLENCCIVVLSPSPSTSSPCFLGSCFCFAVAERRRVLPHTAVRTAPAVLSFFFVPLSFAPVRSFRGSFHRSFHESHRSGTRSG